MAKPKDDGSAYVAPIHVSRCPHGGNPERQNGTGAREIPVC
jgi:hypothetical protein